MTPGFLPGWRRRRGSDTSRDKQVPRRRHVARRGRIECPGANRCRERGVPLPATVQRRRDRVEPGTLIVGANGPPISGPSCHWIPNQWRSSINAATNSGGPVVVQILVAEGRGCLWYHGHVGRRSRKSSRGRGGAVPWERGRDGRGRVECLQALRNSGDIGIRASGISPSR